MINNRQNGRRRGRGGQQRVGGGNPGRPESGNRIDNRARGNASQLYEKYKALAGDAQRQGDRVNTEYYLQFADHYFRVLAESRPRADEQQTRSNGRNDFDDDFDGDGEDYGQEGESAQPDQYQPRADDRYRQDARPNQDGRQGQERQNQDGRPERQDQDRHNQDRQSQDRQGQDRQFQDDRSRQSPRQDARPDDRPRRDDRPRQDGRPEPRQDRPRRDGALDQRPRGDRDVRPDRDPAREPEPERQPEVPAAVAPVMADERMTAPASETHAASTMRAADPDVPLPRRRGRPPKVRPEESVAAATSESSGFDADRLPPSLSLSASAEPDAGEKPRRRRRVAAEPVEADPAG